MTLNIEAVRGDLEKVIQTQLDKINEGKLSGRKVSYGDTGVLSYLQHKPTALVALIAVTWLWDGFSVYCAGKYHDYLKTTNQEKTSIPLLSLAMQTGLMAVGTAGIGIAFAHYSSLSKTAIAVAGFTVYIMRSTVFNEKEGRTKTLAFWPTVTGSRLYS